MRRQAVLIVSLLCAFAIAGAQEKTFLVDRLVSDFFYKITNPNPRFDSTYVTKPVLPWAFTVDNTLLSTGVSIKNEIAVTDYSSGVDNATTINAIFKTRLERHLHKKIGISAGYGSLRLSAGMAVWAKNPGKNSFLSVGLKNPAFGVNVHYYSLQEYLDGRLTIEGVEAPFEFVSDYPATMRSITGEVYYIFNNRRFAYQASTVGNVAQRRSAGSFMLISKYLQGDLTLNSKDRFMLTFTNGLYGYSTRQVSLGGGYSYNFVPISIESADRKTGKGYRNLTFNVTALPMVSFYNNIKSDGLSDDDSKGAAKFSGRVVPTVSLSSGVNLSWDRYGFVASVVYNTFGFIGMPTTIWQDSGRLENNYKTSAAFDDLTAKFSFVVRL